MTSRPLDKARASNKVAADIKAFMKRGGKVQRVPMGTSGQKKRTGYRAVPLVLKPRRA